MDRGRLDLSLPVPSSQAHPGVDCGYGNQEKKEEERQQSDKIEGGKNQALCRWQEHKEEICAAQHQSNAEPQEEGPAEDRNAQTARK